MTFTTWLNKNFTEINGYYYGCPIKYEGMLLTKDYLKEIYNERFVTCLSVKAK